jgi:hypothetical protein
MDRCCPSITRHVTEKPLRPIVTSISAQSHIDKRTRRSKVAVFHRNSGIRSACPISILRQSSKVCGLTRSAIVPPLWHRNYWTDCSVTSSRPLELFATTRVEFHLEDSVH